MTTLTSTTEPPYAIDGGPLWGYLAEFDSVEALLPAAERVRDAGFTRWDTHTPFPVHGLNDAMGVKATKLPWLVFVAGCTGALVGVLLQWWTNAVDYPVIISGKPFWSVPANIPVAFELTILFAAITTFVGMLAFNDLPRWYHALFRVRRFRRVTADRFFISIEAGDPRFDAVQTPALLESLGALHVEAVREEEE